MRLSLTKLTLCWYDYNSKSFNTCVVTTYLNDEQLKAR